MTWLLDFLHQFFKMVDTQRDQALSHCARDAYLETLGTHHPWAVRQAAKLAMYAVPGKETLMLSTGL